MRMYSAELHNRVVNHPSVKPYFGKTDGPVDVSSLLDEPENYVLLAASDDAVGILEWSAPDIWQAHYAMLPACRGRAAVAAAKAMTGYMFEHEGARAVWGQTPLKNKGARWLNRQVGCLSKGFVDRAADGPCELFWLERN